ncbi:MAG: glycoside hydrolase family 172 protein [Mangrovibacterium sp.]
MKTCFLIFITGIFISGLVSCRQTNSGNPELVLSAVMDGRSMAVSSRAPAAESNADRLTYIKPGETVDIATIEGPAVINHIWLTFNEARPNWLEKEGSASPAELVIRMYWDNSPEPAVEAPIGDFFASGFGLRREVKSIPVLVEGGDGYNCYWEMPFHKSAKITVTNDGKKNARSFYYQIDYTKYNKLPPNAAYFCAQYRQEYPEQLGKEYLIADIEGKGHYVGTVMSVRSRSPYWFGEGDVKFYIDGEKEPSTWGTGTEDYFLSAWGFTENLNPYSGCTYMSMGEEDPGQKYCLYRWHIKDPVRFIKSFRFEIEHNGWMSADEMANGKVDGHVEREDDMATVAFWYQQGQPKRFFDLPPYEERILPNLEQVIEGKDMIGSVRHSPGKVELQKGYDWTGDGQILFIPSTNNAWLEVDLTVKNEEYSALILNMSHADNYGDYRVFVDGTAIARVPMTIDFDFDDPKKEIKTLYLYSENLNVYEYYLGSAALKTGKHTIRFEQVGKDPYSKGNALGFDSFRLFKRWNKKRHSLAEEG